MYVIISWLTDYTTLVYTNDGLQKVRYILVGSKYEKGNIFKFFGRKKFSTNFSPIFMACKHL
jgi:hypothetical protein